MVRLEDQFESVMISAMLHETIWFDRPKYEEAEGHYQRFLAGTIPRPVSHVQEFSKKKPEESKPSKVRRLDSFKLLFIECFRFVYRSHLSGNSYPLHYKQGGTGRCKFR